MRYGHQPSITRKQIHGQSGERRGPKDLPLLLSQMDSLGRNDVGKKGGEKKKQTERDRLFGPICNKSTVSRERSSLTETKYPGVSTRLLSKKRKATDRVP